MANESYRVIGTLLRKQGSLNRLMLLICASAISIMLQLSMARPLVLGYLFGLVKIPMPIRSLLHQLAEEVSMLHA